MKKIKNLWNNNRVMFVLVIIVVICIIAMGVVCINLFFGMNSSAYGDRLTDIADKPITEEMQTTMVNKIKENETVDSVNIHTQGKILYIRITFKNVSLDRAKEIAGSTIELIGEEYRKLYDIHYTLIEEKSDTTEGFTIMGSKNISGSLAIVWNNNNTFTEDTDEE